MTVTEMENLMGIMVMVVVMVVVMVMEEHTLVIPGSSNWQNDVVCKSSRTIESS